MPARRVQDRRLLAGSRWVLIGDAPNLARELETRLSVFRGHLAHADGDPLIQARVAVVIDARRELTIGGEYSRVLPLGCLVFATSSDAKVENDYVTMAVECGRLSGVYIAAEFLPSGL